MRNLKPSKEEIEEAKEWLVEVVGCGKGSTKDDVWKLTDEEVVKSVNAYFYGGMDTFLEISRGVY